MRVQRGRALLAAVAALALGLTACSSSGGGNTNSDVTAGTKGTGNFSDCAKNPNTCNSGQTKPGGSVTYTIEKTVVGWNLNFTDSNVFDIAEVLDGVLPSAYIGGSDLKPFLNTDLMVSAEQTKDNPQTLVYKINPKAVWSDGTPINFDDWEYSWQTADPAHCKDCGASTTAGYDQIQSMTPSDNGKTVTVVMKSPFADWQSMFSNLYPAHVAKEHGDDGTPKGLNTSFQWFDQNLPDWSGGPMIISDYQKDTAITEKPNPKWYGKTKSSLDKLTFRIITDQTQEPTALQNNDVQVIYPQPNKDLVDQVNQIQNVQTYVGKGLVWEHFDLNEKNKFLSDKILRQAIFTAINRKDIIARTYGQFVPNMQPLNNHIYVPGQPGYQDNLTGLDNATGDGDLAKAKKMLTDAGYTGVGSSLKTKAGEHVAFRCTYSEGNTYRLTECQIAQNTLKQLGIDVTLKTTPDLGELGTGDFDMIVFAWVGTPFVVGGAQQTYTLKGGGDYANNNDPAAEKLIHEAAGSTDQATVQDKLNQADKLLHQDAFELPLYQKPTFLAAYNNIVNIRDNATSTGPPYNVQEWGVKAG